MKHMCVNDSLQIEYETMFTLFKRFWGTFSGLHCFYLKTEFDITQNIRHSVKIVLSLQN